MRLHLMALVLVFGSVLPGHTVAQIIERDTDRPGGDFRAILGLDNASACERVCFDDDRCRVWTYVEHDHSCILKNTIPQARKDACCTSGMVQERAAGAQAKAAAEAEARAKAERAEKERLAAAKAEEERSAKADAKKGFPVVLPSRAFLPPHDIPPEDFAAYGIVAFPQQAISSTIRRHISICEAFVATLPSASLATVPPKQQMVTVWPIDSASVSVTLATKPDCKVATEHYDLPTALTALKEARTTQRTFLAEGPYLLAWAPSSTKGKKDALVLIADLSDARTDVDFLNRFRAWRDEIEKKPEVWGRGGWSELDLRPLIRRWGDKWGTMIFSISRAKGKDE